jgi:hypothetical protein
MWEELDHKTIGGLEEEETQEVNGGEEPTWPTTDKEACLTASPAEKKDTTLEIAPGKKDEGQKPTLSTSTQKKKWHMKEAKQKVAE